MVILFFQKYFHYYHFKMVKYIKIKNYFKTCQSKYFYIKHRNIYNISVLYIKIEFINLQIFIIVYVIKLFKLLVSYKV